MRHARAQRCSVTRWTRRAPAGCCCSTRPSPTGRLRRPACGTSQPQNRPHSAVGGGSGDGVRWAIFGEVRAAQKRSRGQPTPTMRCELRRSVSRGAPSCMLFWSERPGSRGNGECVLVRRDLSGRCTRVEPSVERLVNERVGRRKDEVGHQDRVTPTINEPAAHGR